VLSLLLTTNFVGQIIRFVFFLSFSWLLANTTCLIPCVGIFLLFAQKHFASRRSIGDKYVLSIDSSYLYYRAKQYIF